MERMRWSCRLLLPGAVLLTVLSAGVVQAAWVDVSDKVSVSSTHPTFDLKTRTFSSNLKVVNTEGQEMAGSMRGVMTSDTNLLNPDGSTVDGEPYYNLNDGSSSVLKGGESTEPVPIRASSPRYLVTYDLRVELLVEELDATDYLSPHHVFSMNDVIGGFDGTTYAEDSGIICTDTLCNGEQPFVDKSGVTLYPIDNEFGFWVNDFVGAEQKFRDGLYEEGWVGNITHDPGFEGIVPNADGVYGLMISNAETDRFKAGAPLGTWCAGLGGNDVKCSTEHYTAMEHVLTCNETVPYFYEPSDVCKPLVNELDKSIDELPPNESNLVDIAVGPDYSVTLKDDGKALFRWGTIVKRPTDVRLYARLQLPSAWKEPGKIFVVTMAELIIRHKVTNNPNDQIRPEDYENEAATGRLPEYRIQDDGSWVSTMDCYEGDGDFIPAGTLLRTASADPDGISADIRAGYTNAWFTTIQREPFEPDPMRNPDGTYSTDDYRSGPRWRLKSNKFGQDLCGLEMPKIDCTAPPLRKSEDQIKYVVGTATITRINLLDWTEGEESPLATSTGWMNDLWVSEEGLKRTEDFDLAIYIKGEVKPATLYDAQLVLDYEEIIP